MKLGATGRIVRGNAFRSSEITMESLVLFLIGAVALIAGSRLLVRSQRPTGARGAVGGAILLIVGAILLVGAFWAMGTVVGNDGTSVKRATMEATP
jgi:hypothetical protein